MMIIQSNHFRNFCEKLYIECIKPELLVRLHRHYLIFISVFFLILSFSMSGKSTWACQAALNWENNFALQKLSQIWLVAQSLSSGMKQSLSEVGKKLGIPVFYCAPQGIDHPFFRASWSRTLKSKNLIPDDAGRKNQNPVSTENDEKQDDNTDENEEYDDRYNYSENKNQNDTNNNEEESYNSDEEKESNTEECKKFLASFLSKNKRKNNCFKKTQKPLSSSPRINTSAKKFLSLKDGYLPTQNFIHTSKSFPSNSDREKYSSLVMGGARTRSMTARDISTNLPTSSESTSPPSPPPLESHSSLDDDQKEKKRGRKRKSEIDDEGRNTSKKNKKKEKEDEVKDQESKSFRAQFELKKEQMKNESSAPIKENSLFIFDDCFSISHKLNENSIDELKNINGEYLKRLSFIKDFMVHKSHLLNVSSMIIEQSILSGSGSSAANSLIKVIRNNAHWICLFPCLLREYRNLLQNLVSGFNFKVFKDVITTCALKTPNNDNSLLDIRSAHPYAFINLTDSNPNFKFRLTHSVNS